MRREGVGGRLARRWYFGAAAVSACIGIAAACLAVGQHAAAAELRLRRECAASGPLVTLGDVAEVFAQSSAETASLESTELFPAPTGSAERYLRLRELEDLLLLKGMNLAEHRFSGASQVVIQAGQQSSSSSTAGPQRPGLGSAALRSAERRLVEAIVARLQSDVPKTDGSGWLVDVEPTPEQARWLSKPDAEVSATLAAPPPASPQGRRTFQVTVDTTQQSVRFAVEAEVSLPVRVVVAAESIPRGALIQQADVTFAPAENGRENRSGSAPPDAFLRLEDVIGKETLRSIPKGKVLTEDLIRAPLLVRRGDVVTVCARAGGVCVRTMARARGDGSQGELVQVESLADRTTYYTRVVRPREVEVYARARQASNNPVTQAPATIRR